MPPRPKIEAKHAPKERAGFPWKVDVSAKLSASGKREKTYYRTKAAADEFCKTERERMAEFSDAARHITGEQKLEYYKANQIAARLGFTVMQAVEHMAVSVEQSRRSIPVPKLVDALIAAKEKAGKRGHYIRDLRNRLKRLSKAFPDALATELTAEKAENWLAMLTEEGHSPISRNNYRRILGVALSYAVSRGWIAHNFIKQVSELDEPEEEVKFFTPAEVDALLQAAGEGIRPALAIGAFAGIRPEEILLLRWKHVRLDHGDILVEGKSAKTGSRRLVKITVNLRPWLGDVERHDPAASVVPPNFVKLRAAARKAAEIKDWHRDGLRHSYASYHLALHEDAAATALQLGHTTTKMLFDAYRGLVRKPDAVRYFEIVPNQP